MLVVIIHYLTRGNQIFCCVENSWYSIPCVTKSCVIDDEVDYYVEVGTAVQVEPPEGVLYSHSESIDSDGQSFDPNADGFIDYYTLEWLAYQI